MTPVQEQKRVEQLRPSVPVAQQQQHEVNRRQLFPHPPTQCFQAPEIPNMATGQRWLRGSSQDVRRDPHFQQPPPEYSQVQQHRQQPPAPIEVNEMGPTIQRGIIQCPVQQKPQSAPIDPISKNVLHLRGMQQSSTTVQNQDQNRGNLTPDSQQIGRGRLPGNEVYINSDDNMFDTAQGYKFFC